MRAAAALAALAALGAAPPAPLARALDRDGFVGVAIAGSGPRPSAVVVRGRHGADAAWRWASVTKQLTALLVMQEVAAGRIALDSPVTAYWPDWPHVFADAITIRDLMRHTSGLADPNEDGPDGADGLPLFYRPAPAAGAMAYAAAHYCAEHPRTKPGVTFHYDNCDYIVLGAILERVTGRPYAALVEERIARPLGIRIGLFRPGAPPVPQVAGTDAHGRRKRLGDLGAYGAAGAAYGTPRALYAFDRALLSNRLLDAARTATMWTGEPRWGQAALGQWEYRVALTGCAAPVRIVERRGQIGGVQVRNLIFPDSGRALVIFTPREAFAFGEIWQGKGAAYRAAAAVECMG